MFEQALGRFRGPARRYLDGRGPAALGHLTRDEAVEGLAAVLAEAAGERGDSEWRGLWNDLVDRGLGLLPVTAETVVHTRELPGLNADQLPPVFTVADAVTGQAGAGDEAVTGTLIQVLQPDARNLSALPGQTSGTVMFRPGTEFVVIADEVVSGGRIVQLRHRRAAQAEDEGQVAASRPPSARSVQYHPLAVPEAGPLSEPGSLSEPGIALDAAMGQAEWESRNQWWSADLSDQRTGRQGVFRPSLHQRGVLDENRLAIRWVPSGGDCTFTAMAYTLPQAEVRRLILQAAQRWDIGVPDGEDDQVGWLLGQAVDAARTDAARTDLRDVIERAQRQGREIEQVPDGVEDAVAWLLDRAMERAALPPVGPDDLVTGPHLRLFLAYLLAKDRGLDPNDRWRVGLFHEEETLGEALDDDALTRRGMVAAVRWMRDYALPYGDHFPSLIAELLGPLQVLEEDGTLRRLGASDAGETPYTIVLRRRHYLATVSRPESPGESDEDPGPGDGEPPPDSDGDTGGAAGRPLARRHVQYQPVAWTGDVQGRKSPTPPPTDEQRARATALAKEAPPTSGDTHIGNMADPPIELIRLAPGSGFSRYLAAVPPTDAHHSGESPPKP